MIPDIYRLAIRKSLKLVFKNIYNQKALKGLSVFFIKTKHKSNYTQVFRVKKLWNDFYIGCRKKLFFSIKSYFCRPWPFL